MALLKLLVALTATIHLTIDVVAIRCVVCEKSYTEERCEAEGGREPCYEQAAIEYFKMFKKIKDTIAEPYWNTGYQCFELQVRNGSSKFLKGCTFENLDLCEDLKGANVSWCYTCKEDYCNSMEMKGAGRRIEGLGWIVGILVVIGFMLSVK